MPKFTNGADIIGYSPKVHKQILKLFFLEINDCFYIISLYIILKQRIVDYLWARVPVFMCMIRT